MAIESRRERAEPLLIGTRGSRLALRQAQEVMSLFGAAFPELPVGLKQVRTSGDEQQSSALDRFGQTGVFTRELEAALLDERVQLAVHSLKDMPVDSPAGLLLGAVPPRADSADWLVSNEGYTLDILPQGARVATGSPRRKAQLLALRPDVQVVPIRGNVDTRLKKLADGQADALVLAAAGLTRLGLQDTPHEALEFDQMLPAPGQGALGVQASMSLYGFSIHGVYMSELLAGINDPLSYRTAAAEKAVLRHFGGGCHVPLGAVCEQPDPDTLLLRAGVFSVDGRRAVRTALSGAAANPDDLGRRVAEDLLEKGGREIIFEPDRGEGK